MIKAGLKFKDLKGKPPQEKLETNTHPCYDGVRLYTPPVPQYYMGIDFLFGYSMVLPGLQGLRVSSSNSSSSETQSKPDLNALLRVPRPRPIFP